MRRLTLLMTIVLAVALAAAGWWLASRYGHFAQDLASFSALPDSDVVEPTAHSSIELPKLPETSPPEGLPITLWGKRDQFPIIRKPWLVDCRLGDTMLVPDEPVLGIAMGSEARAYSTNQLNAHEMVVDDIDGRPILVTY
jgi:Protein of unknown function (DUF3179)